MSDIDLDLMLAGLKAQAAGIQAGPPTQAIEKDWQTWLTAVAPRTFTGSWSSFHTEFWDWFWTLIQKRRRGESITREEQAFLAIWARGQGKCLAADTPIWLVDGTVKPISDVEVGDTVCSVDTRSGKHTTDKVVNKWSSGLRPCWQLTTRTNHTIVLTSEHRLWTYDGWKRLADISVGDRVAVPRRIACAPCERVASDEEVRLLAYMIAEGSTTACYQPSGTRSIACHAGFTNADEVIVDDFTRCAEAMGFTVSDAKSKYQYRLVGAQQWLRDVEMSGKGAHEKHIPVFVFNLPESQRWQFLAALIDTDGYVTRGGVGITLASKQLVNDIQRLFLTVGVASKIHYKSNSGKGAWVLTVDKTAALICAEKMPLRLKQDRLAKFASIRRYSLWDVYPAKAAQSLPKGVNRAMRRAGGPRIGNSRYDITRDKIQKAMEFYSHAAWEWLENADVFWDRVESIVEVGERETYDIETRQYHNFIANGIVSHNSSNVEWAAIAEGALIGTGYVLYVSGTQVLAEGHVQAIRERLESEEVAHYYPHLSAPKVGRHGNQYGWRQNFLITSGGWAIRPIGLDVGVRGGRVGDIRPTLIVGDDIDDHTDSPHVVQKKLDTLARSIIPAGTRETIFLGAQNLIHRNSVFNQIVTNRTSVLSRRIVSGPYPAFKGLELELRQTPTGPRYLITGGEPTWEDMDLDACQKFLDDSGYESFLAEYQHDFSAIEQGRVVPEFDEDVHVITWSDFERIYGQRYIPAHWARDVGHDVGFTEGHISAFSFVATSSANSKLPGMCFLYRGMTFVKPLLDDMAAEVLRAMKPDIKSGRNFDEKEIIQRWRMSHEAKSERDTYNVKFDMPFIAGKSGKQDGISQLRHYLRCDKTIPHPFKYDEQLEDGSYRLGCPAFYFIVDDDQLAEPRDDRGLAIHRRQLRDWRWKVTPLTEAGMKKDEPVKADEDTCFVAGTMIHTETGLRPIEQIQAGDLVWTTGGLRPVMIAGRTSYVAPTVRVTFSDGTTLRGTPKHPVFTLAGVCPLRKLRGRQVVTFEASMGGSSQRVTALYCEEMDEAEVYNLTVSGVHEYFANGILVHNCDSLRMVTAMWGPSVTPRTAEEQREAMLPAGLTEEKIAELRGFQLDMARMMRAYELKQLEQAQGPRHWSTDVFEPGEDKW